MRGFREGTRLTSGWRYRISSASGVALLTGLAVLLANLSRVQAAVLLIPIVKRLPATTLTGTDLELATLTTVGVVLVVFLPMYKPRPRRILDTISLAQKRTLVAVFALATIGYFDYTYRLPRITLLIVTPLLLVVLPLWLVGIRQRPPTGTERALIVGDDVDEIKRIAADVTSPLCGYLCPTIAVPEQTKVAAPLADGGDLTTDLKRLGGLSRIEDILTEYDIDTVILAFQQPDRAEFFGALDACYEQGVAAKVHREHADAVLTAESDVGQLVDVKVEPWDRQDYVLKRGFDIAFAFVGLLVNIPVMVGIAIAIKLDDGGPVLYDQERTAVFGEIFTVYKFRSMTTEGESATPVEDEENNRITNIGRVLRRTHLDEIPQLWSVLVGDMSVVGPRAVWTEEEHLIEEEVEMWRKRWFVKPGLTGLAQVNDVKSTKPGEKLRYDLQYVKQQSFWFDMKLVIRQIWKVCVDVLATTRD